MAETFCTLPTNTRSETGADQMSAREVMTGRTPAEYRAVDLLCLSEVTLAEAAGARRPKVTVPKLAIHRATRNMKAALWKE